MRRLRGLVRFGVAAAVAATPLLFAGPAHAGVSFDVGMLKSHTGNFTVGQPGVFTLTVQNLGPGDTANDPITVTDTLPAGLTYASDTGASVGYPCTAVGQTVTCTGAPTSIPNGSDVTFQITVNVDSSAVPSVTNTAVVSDAVQADNDPDNDTASDTVTVNAAAATTSTTSTTAPASTTATTAPVATEPAALARTGFPTVPAVVIGLGLVAIGLAVLRFRRFNPSSR
jgi:uncharacterized repeat protein (TIGR01451 family)